ncbi:MAG: hypothetical protein IPK53_03950 [bacterium]|nr:hypothetical protein [bacterium]
MSLPCGIGSGRTSLRFRFRGILIGRTPDAHFLVEARHRGAEVVVFSPDFSIGVKVPPIVGCRFIRARFGFRITVGHTILREYYVERMVPFFVDYQKQFTDGPILVELHKQADGTFKPGQYVRASQVVDTGRR